MMPQGIARYKLDTLKNLKLHFKMFHNEDNLKDNLGFDMALWSSIAPLKFWDRIL